MTLEQAIIVAAVLYYAIVQAVIAVCYLAVGNLTTLHKNLTASGTVFRVLSVLFAPFILPLVFMSLLLVPAKLDSTDTQDGGVK